MLLFITSLLACPVILNYLSKYSCTINMELLDVLSVALSKLLPGSKLLGSNSECSVGIFHSCVEDGFEARTS